MSLALPQVPPLVRLALQVRQVEPLQVAQLVGHQPVVQVRVVLLQVQVLLVLQSCYVSRALATPQEMVGPVLVNVKDVAAPDASQRFILALCVIVHVASSNSSCGISSPHRWHRQSERL